ncbi:hypothetical protein WDU94_007827 [Cyamophila willieti]
MALSRQTENTEVGSAHVHCYGCMENDVRHEDYVNIDQDEGRLNWLVKAQNELVALISENPMKRTESRDKRINPKPLNNGTEDTNSPPKKKHKVLSSGLENSCRKPALKPEVLPLQNSQQKRGRLILIGDSHVRKLKDFIRAFDSKVNVIDHFRGGASLLEICDYLKETITMEDHVFVFGGTNDVDRRSMTKLKPALVKLLEKCPHGRITFILVPLRVSWNRQYYQNNSILAFNKDLENFLEQQQKQNHNLVICIVDINQILCAGHYSPDGIHLNDSGKKVVCDAILSVMST